MTTRTHRGLCAGLVFLLGLGLTGCHWFGRDGSDDDSPARKQALQLVEDSAAAVEKAFASGDPQRVMSVLTEEAQAQYKGQLAGIQPKLAAFARDFATRRINALAGNYAEYEFDARGQKFTVAFARQADGSWKLMRF